MHVADLLKSENVHITIEEQVVSLDEVFPESHKYDRFGFIVTEPYGGLGASLLIQAAIVQFYDILPERRDENPMYPEIYMFHIGGKYGDHSSFDFWPPRKEIFLDSGAPAEVMSALVDRGITRLAIPDGSEGRPDLLQNGASTWADHSAATNLLSSCIAYAPSGTTRDADMTMESDDHTFEANAEWTLDTEIILGRYRRDPESIYRPGPTVASDIDRWVETMESRDGEVDQALAQKLLAQRCQAEGERMVRRETFRRIDLDETFRLLAGL